MRRPAGEKQMLTSFLHRREASFCCPARGSFLHCHISSRDFSHDKLGRLQHLINTVEKLDAISKSSLISFSTFPEASPCPTSLPESIRLVERCKGPGGCTQDFSHPKVTHNQWREIRTGTTNRRIKE
ncbi:unnamed protein product [Urochloa humidicola]